MKDKLGICQWFHYQDFAQVERVADLLRELGVRHLRTGISWADFHRPEGRAWYDFQLAALADFELLVSIWHTPPSIAEGGRCAGPPRRLADYGDFAEWVVELYGDRIAAIELWNEPNNRLKWDFESFDPKWRKFGRMIADAGSRLARHGMPTVLGGMIPVDPAWLERMRRFDAVDAVDAVAIHGFPEMWWPEHPNWEWYSHWHGWADKVAIAEAGAAGRPVWITETGLATWDLFAARTAKHRLQVDCLQEVAVAPVDRVYWYCLVDLDPAREAIEGFHVDENEYHLGLVTWEGERKPAWDAMAELLAREEDDSDRLPAPRRAVAGA